MAINTEDIVGLTGVALTLIAYFLLQVEIIKSEGLAYSLINALGSVFIFYAILHAWNLSAAVMEICWLVMSIYGCLKYFVIKYKAQAEE